MELEFTIRGRCCDLALHPVSEKTAEMIRRLGADTYKEKPLRWWRKGKTSTCGMRMDSEAVIEVKVNGQPVCFDANLITKEPFEIRRRMYLEGKARHICLLGYDNELCGSKWTWKGIGGEFDPAGFEFLAQRWDRVMGVPDYLILDDIRYCGRFADDHEWCDDSKGFTLVDPKLIDLNQVRAEILARQALRNAVSSMNEDDESHFGSAPVPQGEPVKS